MAAPTLFPESGFRRLRLDIAYDGTHFFGWATQPGHRTLQDLIEEAISRISQTNIDSIVAGRTDAGVHATGQVIHVDVPDSTSLDELAFKLNRMLDEDIRINNVTIASGAFHARFSATRRYYTYKIMDGNKAVPPINRFDITPWYRTLDVDLLNSASALLIGEHDFAAYCKFREGSTTVRNLVRFDWARNSEGILIAELAADSFCYSMVRNLVGAAVCVAEGRFSPDWIHATLENKERISDSLVFPSRGLTLTQVDYPKETFSI